MAGSTATARPPPHAVCGVCSDDVFGSAAGEEGVSIGVAESSLAIRIDESGTGHWTARVQLTGSDVEIFEENQTLRTQVVTRVHERGYVAVENPRSLTASMNGSTLVVEYAVPGMAHESVGGVHVVDFFHWNGGEARWFHLAADETTIRGPPGSVVTHAPTNAVGTGNAVTWQGGESQFRSALSGSHVVFAPEDGLAASVATGLGIGSDVAQLKAGDLIAAAVPGMVLATVVGFLLAFSRRLAAVPPWQLAVVGVGALLALALVSSTVGTLVGASSPLTTQFGESLSYLVVGLLVTGAGLVVLLGVPLVAGQVLLARRLLGADTAAGAGPSGSSGIDTRVERLLTWPAVALLGVE